MKSEEFATARNIKEMKYIMKSKNIIVAAAVSFMLTGCGLYNKYESKAPLPDEAYGTSQDIKAAENGTSLAQMSWREFFTDPLLQQLIEQVLANNTDRIPPASLWRRARHR